MFASIESSHAAVETAGSEELRNRAKREAQEREQQQKQKLPSVDLQGELPGAEPFQLPIAETPCFTIQHFVLEVPDQLSPQAHRDGASKLPTDTFRFAQNFLNKYAGRCIGREGVNLIVRGVTAKILKRGYSTTRVGIPEQDLAVGTLKLTLIPGLIHELRFADKEVAGTWKNAFPTSAGKLLNLRDLEQGLEQMKRVPSQEVEMQIIPADQIGESDIVISVKRGKPWRATATLDDSGVKATGKEQAGLQLGWDNLLGANDLLNIGTSTDAERNNYMRGTQGNNLSYSAPFGYWTATLSANESDYHQRVVGAVQSFVSSGKYQNLETRISYLFYRDQTSKSSLQFRTGKRFSHAYIDDTEIAVQKRNNTLAEIALLHKYNIGEAQLDATVAYQWGAPWFGAQVDPANLSGSSPRYNYALETIDTTLTVPLPLNDRTLMYSATFRAQNTNTALYPTEWFSIGNRWTVRGFDGEVPLQAEKGFFLRNEIGIPLANTMQSAYAGIDFGEVYGPSTAMLVGNKLAGAVIGLRGSLTKSSNYDVFVSNALYKPKNMRTDQPAMGFSLAFQM